MSEFDKKFITDAITRMLARREHSFLEVSRKLSQKGIEENAYMPVLQAFKDADIQSDQRFAESRARALYFKGAGPRKIKLDLQQHGIDEHLAEQALIELEPEWFEMAKQVKEKKFGINKETDFKRLMKQKQFLQYRGFYTEHIEYAVNGE